MAFLFAGATESSLAQTKYNSSTVLSDDVFGDSANLIELDLLTFGVSARANPIILTSTSSTSTAVTSGASTNTDDFAPVSSSSTFGSSLVSGGPVSGGSNSGGDTIQPIPPGSGSEGSGGDTIQPIPLPVSDGGGISIANGVTATLDSNGGTFTINGVIHGTNGSINKIGAGSLILNGANTYTGTTTVSAGTLLVNGNQSAATGTVTVNSGGTLGGTGIIGGAVSIADGATLSPGASAGTLTTGALTLSDSSNLVFELGTLSDLVVVNGNLTLDGQLTVSQLAGFGAGSYELFSYSGTLTNNTLDVFSAPSGFTYSIDISTGGSVLLDVTAAPEPSTWIGGSLALTALLFTQRRRMSRVLKRAI